MTKQFINEGVRSVAKKSNRANISGCCQGRYKPKSLKSHGLRRFDFAFVFPKRCSKPFGSVRFCSAKSAFAGVFCDRSVCVRCAFGRRSVVFDGVRLYRDAGRLFFDGMNRTYGMRPFARRPLSASFNIRVIRGQKMNRGDGETQRRKRNTLLR